jgi:hypothetical protein
VARPSKAPISAVDSPSELASPESQRAAGARRSRRFEIGVTALWMLNVALLLGAGVWILLDGRFPQGVTDFRAHASSLLRAPGAEAPKSDVGDRIAGLYAIALGGAATLLLIAAALVIGPPRHRRVRSWLALTALVAGWLALAVAWPDLAWQGAQWRMARQIAAFEPAATSLRTDWPADDDQRDAVGAFMAYPQPNPTMLLLLAPKEGAAGRRFSAVERSPAGALRFELMGAESGDWLEWHPTGSVPQSFISGLRGDYQLIRAAPLRDGWYAARYRNAGPTEAP